MKRIIIAAAFAWPIVAHAEPPPVGSDDWNAMAPFKEYVTSQHDGLGRWCCDIGDARPVEATIGPPSPAERGNVPLCAGFDASCVPPDANQLGPDHWWVLVEHKHFPNETPRWMLVPDEKVTHHSNPTGVPILWLYQGRVQCFAAPDGA